MNPDDEEIHRFTEEERETLKRILVGYKPYEEYTKDTSGYERRPEYSRGGYTGPGYMGPQWLTPSAGFASFSDDDDETEALLDQNGERIVKPRYVGPSGSTIASPDLIQSFSNSINGITQAYTRLGLTASNAVEQMLKAYIEHHKPELRWSDDVEPGSPHTFIKGTNNIKKESGVKLRESIDASTTMARPKPSKTICRTHGRKFILNREDMSWGCMECEQGRVAFNKWYKDTYSLGYLQVHKFSGAKHGMMPQEIVITADESFRAVAIMIQRAEPGVDAPVFVTDLGDIAVDIALKIEPDESGVRTINLPSLYGLGEQVLTDDEDDEDPTIYDT